MNRRRFLASLAASASSTIFASSALATINPQPNTIDIGWEDNGDGWYRVWKPSSGTLTNFSIDFGEEGLRLDADSRATVHQETEDTITFSCWVRKTTDFEKVRDCNIGVGND